MSQHEPNARRVLVVTYAFPPVAYVGVYRTLKYCKYFADFGWTPVVLTARPHRAAHQDRKLCEQVPPGVRVYRSLDFDPVRWIDRISPPRPPAPTPAGKPKDSVAAPQPVSHQASFIGSSKQFLRGLLTQAPDSHVFWIPFALLTGAWILMTQRVEVIYCSSPPHSSHLLAYLLAKLFRKPYVLDYRDPWYVDGSVRSPDKKNPVIRKIETRLKRKLVRSATRVISATRGERDEFRAEYADLPAERFDFITNGYDPSDFNITQQDAAPGERLSLIHAGTLYGGIADELFAALRRLLEEQPVAARRIVVNLVGEVADEYGSDIAHLEAAGSVRCWGLLPHARTLEMVASSDVLLILLGGSRFRPSHLPAKVFEYLHVGKPILAVAPEGELTEIVRRSGLGRVLPPHSVDALVNELAGLARPNALEWAQKQDTAYIRSFERSVLTAKLARVLDEIVEPHPRPT